MKAQLFDLMSEDELNQIPKYENIPIDSLICYLTVKQLSALATILIRTETGERITGQFIFSARAIEILTARAIKKNLSIF